MHTQKGRKGRKEKEKKKVQLLRVVRRRGLAAGELGKTGQGSEQRSRHRRALVVMEREGGEGVCSQDRKHRIGEGKMERELQTQAHKSPRWCSRARRRQPTTERRC